LIDSCRFDKRITTFATEKFQRDGIDVKTGSMVVKVSDKDISTKERKTGEIVSVPYGVVLWSTGIATRPVVRDFMNHIDQVCGSATMSILLFHLHF
jgi:NADH:ubiquinone reductase (non-electrogenic)